MDGLVIVVAVLGKLWHCGEDEAKDLLQPCAEAWGTRVCGARTHGDILPLPAPLPFLHRPTSGRWVERVGELGVLLSHMRGDGGATATQDMHPARATQRGIRLSWLWRGNGDLREMGMSRNPTAHPMVALGGGERHGGVRHPAEVQGGVRGDGELRHSTETWGHATGGQSVPQGRLWQRWWWWC